MTELGVGLVGSGFMGRCHANAFGSVGTLFDPTLRPKLVSLADIDEVCAARAARTFGFAKAVGDWRELIADPDVDLVAITAPNRLHKPIALGAIQVGKHVYCEKPLATCAEDAALLTHAAEEAGVFTLVGFNFLKNPMIALAREIVSSGEIGDVIGFRGIHAEDYMADPASPFTFRHEPDGGGATADLGSHIISIARFLLGPIRRICATTETIHRRRPTAPGSAELRSVEVDDQMRALIDFDRGASGSLEASWVASGRKMQLAFDITGSNGSLSFTQERFNELRLYEAGQRTGREGFKVIEAGPDHSPYAAFCPAPGHQLGFNDLKVIEVAHLLAALNGEAIPFPDFREAWAVQCVVDAAITSARHLQWQDVSRECDRDDLAPQHQARAGR